jgi:hypothetical protein
MKTLRRIIIVVAALLWCAGCTPGKDDTIIVFGGESNFQTMEDLMKDYLSVTEQEAFLSELDIMPNDLLFPPNINGEYKISMKQYLNSNIGFDFFDDDQDVLLRVFDQQNRLAKVDFFENGTSRIDDAYVIGKDNLFNLYFKENREMEFMGKKYRYDRLVVITGEKDRDGIRNLHFGNVILEVENSEDPLVGEFQSGWYFIYKDADGMSELGNWF